MREEVGGRQYAAGGERLEARGFLPAAPRFVRLVFLLTAYCLPPTAYCLLPTTYCLAGSWTKQPSGSFAWLHAVYFLNEWRGWAAGGKGSLLETFDGGQSWRSLARPTDDSLQDIYFADERSGWLVCERSIYDLKEGEPRAYLLRTEDGGRTWRRVNVLKGDADSRLVRALFTEGGRGWVFGEAGALYTTRDGGSSWERQSVPTRYLLLGGSFLNSAQGWLVGAGSTLLQTTDGGESWRAGLLSGAQPPAASGAKQGVAPRWRFTAASFVNPRRGWAVGAGGCVFNTRDGGRTWAPQSSNITEDLLDVKFFDEYEGWASGAGGTLIHTRDGGAHWYAEESGTKHALERLFFVGRDKGWAVGFGGTIISYTPAAPPRTPQLKK